MRLTLTTLTTLLALAMSWALVGPSGLELSKGGSSSDSQPEIARCEPGHGCGCSPDTIMTGACCCIEREVEPAPEVDSCCSTEESAKPAWHKLDALVVLALPPQPVRNVTPIGCGCDDTGETHALPPPEQRPVLQWSEMPTVLLLAQYTPRCRAYVLPASHVTAPRPPPPRFV
jgi:hypothetical protein